MAKKKDEKTNVMRILDQQSIPYTAHFYEGTDPNNTSTYGVSVAETLGQDPESTLKTLVARSSSGAVYVFEVPVAENLDLKKAARSVGEKNVELLPVKEITAVTGYIRGGCSPIGMKKEYPTVLHETVQLFDTVHISGGKIGVDVEIGTEALRELVQGKYADIIKDA